MADEEKKKEDGSFLLSPGRIQLSRPAPPPPPGAAAPAGPSPELEKAVRALQEEVQALKAKQDPKTEKDLEQINRKLEILTNTVRELDSTAIQERISASAVKISGLEAGFSDMSKALLSLKKEVNEAVAGYGDGIRELKNGLHALKTDSAYLESGLEKLRETAAGLEKDLGPGLEELRAKMGSLEKLEKRAFLKLETGLEKSFQEKFRDMLAQLKTVKERLEAVSEDYRLVIDKRMVLLESKYSALETFGKRLDFIAKEIRK